MRNIYLHRKHALNRLFVGYIIFAECFAFARFCSLLDDFTGSYSALKAFAVAHAEVYAAVLVLWLITLGAKNYFGRHQEK